MWGLTEEPGVHSPQQSIAEASYRLEVDVWTLAEETLTEVQQSREVDPLGWSFSP